MSASFGEPKANDRPVLSKIAAAIKHATRSRQLRGETAEQPKQGVVQESDFQAQSGFTFAKMALRARSHVVG